MYWSVGVIVEHSSSWCNIYCIWWEKGKNLESNEVLAISIYLSVSQPVAEGLTGATAQWSIHVLSLSFCFSSSITQACAEALLIIITSLHAQAPVMKIKHSLKLIHQGKIYQYLLLIWFITTTISGSFKQGDILTYSKHTSSSLQLFVQWLCNFYQNVG